MELESAQELYQRLLNRRDVLKNLMKEPYTRRRGVRSVMNAKASLPGIEGVVKRAARRDGGLWERDLQCAGRRHVSYRVCR
ncbi:MAG: hypothetical protein V8T10_00120 [Merdibacter sp.]